MSLAQLHKIIKLAAIILWLVAIALVIVAIIKHQFWKLMPIIAYNRPQNYLGWIISFALACTIASPLIKLISLTISSTLCHVYLTCNGETCYDDV
ncbi:hypothetical protein H5S09_07500 [Limosilactobacillus sp. STM2_1]|uniref:Uncharacterized protein n=1 Tax=Limosilactobacillus rudii TaxID=2759755 RepID=A0A7W3YMS9_9LACO|nr:hypothetical protein [Limosilactobacillus rudii]MBB1079756.1 hypothetical protein [Limosilactobacillus rudii]MBB1097784.1 hypothetical protein [Limosilactobacillus rudii]MCD7134865.1 hypothetical protein [Limosilactobacillus rudii]